MSLQDKYNDLLNLIVVKKLKNPSAIIKLMNEVQELSVFFGVLKGDMGQVSVESSAEEFTFEGGSYITTVVSEVGGVKKLTISSTVSPLKYQGVWDASGGNYPTGAVAGDYYVVNVAGTISGVVYDINDWMVYNGTSWDKIEGQTKVENDLTPKLAGNLDANSKNITNLANLSLSGDIAVSGNVDGVDVSVLKTDVDGFPDELKNFGNIYYCSTEAEINSALTSIGANGGTIILKSGTITLSATITINIAGSVVIIGMRDKTIINCNGERSAFSITGCVSCIFRDFKIDAQDLTTNTKEIINVAETSNNKITIENITIIGDGTHGVGVELNSNNCIVQNCNFNNIYYGILANSSDKHRILNNELSNNRYGLYLFGSDQNIIKGNICFSNTEYGIYIYNSSLQNQVSLNICNSNNIGIHLSTSANKNNIDINSCFSNNEYGILISESDSNTINNNTCNENLRSGIALSLSDNNVVVGNICQDNDSNDDLDNGGITLITSDQNVINGNNCLNNNNAGTGTAYGILIGNAICDDNIVMGNTALGNDNNYGNSGTNTFDSTATDGDPLNNFVSGAG